jgi:hypothetical protein
MPRLDDALKFGTQVYSRGIAGKATGLSPAPGINYCIAGQCLLQA